MEEALRQSETKFRTLYDSTNNGVILLDENSLFDCNTAAMELFGCATQENLCSHRPADLSPPKQPCGTDFHYAERPAYCQCDEDRLLPF